MAVARAPDLESANSKNVQWLYRLSITVADAMSVHFDHGPSRAFDAALGFRGRLFDFPLQAQALKDWTDKHAAERAARQPLFTSS
jgi:hypothetical protein